MSESVEIAVRTRFATLVEDALGVPTVYDNGPALGDDASPYDPPDPTTDVWARAAVLLGSAIVTESAGPIGGRHANTFQTPGVLLVSLYGPLERGDAALLTLATQVASAFSAASTPTATYTTPELGPGRRDGAWWRMDVACPFLAGETAVD